MTNEKLVEFLMGVLVVVLFFVGIVVLFTGAVLMGHMVFGGC